MITKWSCYELDQRQESGDFRLVLFIFIVCMAATIILSVLSLDVFSGAQKLALTITLLGWVGVGYWAFGRNQRNKDN